MWNKVLMTSVLPVVWLVHAVTVVVLHAVRTFLDSALIHRGVQWWWSGERMAQDRVVVQKGVTIKEDTYGTGPRESAYVLCPEGGDAFADGKAMLFLHGGGWSVANAWVLLHSVACFAREGYTVYAPNYPLATTHPFPHAIISILRALHHLRVQHGVTKVHIQGESAGGNLATMVTMLVANPHLLHRLQEECPDTPLTSWVFPEVAAVTSIYGLLDRTSWRAPIKGVNRVETAVCSFLYEMCFRVYETKALGGRTTIADWMDDVHTFPPVLLISGERDPLCHSSALVHWELRRRSFVSELMVVPGARHAFFGFPPDWSDDLIQAQYPVYRAIAKQAAVHL